jgi:hypothetical protein
MWREILLALIAALMAPLMLLVWKIFRATTVFREYPPHRHVGDEIQYPVHMEPGKTEKLHRGASTSP